MERTRLARLSAILYLLVILSGLFSLAFVPSQLIPFPRKSPDLASLHAREGVLRWGILASAVCYTGFMLLSLTLYRLLNQINSFWAMAMVVFALCGIPMAMGNLQYLLDILRLVDTGSQANPRVPVEILRLPGIAWEKYRSGLLICSLTWGLWLLPLGYLVRKSGFLPAVSGVFLQLGGLAYLIRFGGRILFSHYESWIWTSWIQSLPGFAEMSFCGLLFWLGWIKKTSKP